MKAPSLVSHMDLADALKKRGKFKWELAYNQQPQMIYKPEWHTDNCQCKTCIQARVELIKELEGKHGEAIDYACSWSCSEATNRLSLLEKWKNATTQAAKEIAAYVKRKMDFSPARVVKEETTTLGNWTLGSNIFTGIQSPSGGLVVQRVECLMCGHVTMQDATLPVPEKCHHCGYDFRAGIS